MSRFDGLDDEDEVPPQLRHQITRRAMFGKPGQAMLRKLEAALLSLPEKRLIDGGLCNDGEVCAIGAIVVKSRVENGEEREEILEELSRGFWDGDPFDTVYAARGIGMTESLAWSISWANDEHCAVMTPEERYKAMLAWVRERLLPVAEGVTA